MDEKIKIISDGERAKIYLDGKKVKCTDIDFVFKGHVDKEPRIECEVTYYKENENGSYAYDTINGLLKETVRIGGGLYGKQQKTYTGRESKALYGNTQ